MELAQLSCSDCGLFGRSFFLTLNEVRLHSTEQSRRCHKWA